jgi:hypothetical protein
MGMDHSGLCWTITNDKERERLPGEHHGLIDKVYPPGTNLNHHDFRRDGRSICEAHCDEPRGSKIYHIRPRQALHIEILAISHRPDGNRITDDYRISTAIEWTN